MPEWYSGTEEESAVAFEDRVEGVQGAGFAIGGDRPGAAAALGFDPGEDQPVAPFVGFLFGRGRRRGRRARELALRLEQQSLLQPRPGRAWQCILSGAGVVEGGGDFPAAGRVLAAAQERGRGERDSDCR